MIGGVTKWEDRQAAPPIWGPSTPPKQALKRSIASNGEDFTPFNLS